MTQGGMLDLHRGLDGEPGQWFSSTSGECRRERDVLVTRWIDDRDCHRREQALSSPNRHVIGMALRAARLKFIRGARIIFEGIMPPGTLHVVGPSQPLVAELYSPCEFIHFHVSNDYIRQRQDALGVASTRPPPELDDIILRDPLADSLGRTLLKSNMPTDEIYAEAVGQVLVMHIVRMQFLQRAARPLPTWRLKRVQAHIGAHLEETLSLSELAAAAGLSPMHFAGQFRAATGYRPHDYLLYQRVERAKSILSSTDTPLVEVALSVGFRVQAHFSTVFKRITGESPGSWRRALLSERRWPVSEADVNREGSPKVGIAADPAKAAFSYATSSQ
jgi:AraC family transcriptional regulator